MQFHSNINWLCLWLWLAETNYSGNHAKKKKERKKEEERKKQKNIQVVGFQLVRSKEACRKGETYIQQWNENC